MKRINPWLLLLALLSTAPAYAEDVLQIPRAANPPRLEDYVSGIPADAGIEVSDFRQNKPGDGNPATLRTRAYLSRDDTHLYVVFVCTDDPKLVRARIARRDDVFGDDGVQLLLDTYHDKQRAYVFTVNPFGAQMDSRYTEGLGYDFDYDTQWSSDGRLTDDGYVVTIQIPFKSLRFEQGNSQDWGIAVNRIIPRLNEFVYWPYITERKEGFIPQFATARIEDTIAPGRNIQIIPHVTYRDTKALDFDAAGVPRIKHERRAEAGVDAKFVIKDAITVDLTVNPDFGEVESDEPQAIVNQRYEVLFPEKRPFFLENSGIFGLPVSLFFSRRVVNPQYGARVTGQVGRWAVGGLLIDDEDAGLFSSVENAGKTGRISVARVQRDVGTQSNVGVLVSDRSIGDEYNRVYGLDSRVKLNDNWTVNGQAVGSRSNEAGDYARDGHVLFAQATRSSRDFFYDAQIIDISRDFEAELGFVPRTNIRQIYQKANYLWQFPDAPWLISVGPTLVADRTWDQDGDLQDWQVNAGFVVNGLRQTTFAGSVITSYEEYAGQGFHKNGYTLSAGTEWWKWLTLQLEYGSRESINFVPADGVEPFLGDARFVGINFTVSPTAQLRIDQNFIWNDLRTQKATGIRGSDENVFRNTLSRTKVKYQFSRFLAAHVIFNYTALDSDTALFAFPRDKQLTTDFLVSYSPNPGTALYLGYTDQQRNLRLFENPNYLVSTRDLDLHSGKQIFMKFSYLFTL